MRTLNVSYMTVQIIQITAIPENSNIGISLKSTVQIIQITAIPENQGNYKHALD